MVATKARHDAMTNVMMQEKLAGSYAVGKKVRMHRWWTIDHIIPVADDGPLHDLDNLRTACMPCHKQITKEQQPGMTRPRHARTRSRVIGELWKGGEGLPHSYISYMRDRSVD
jgi:hypothetical protein